MEEEIWKQVVGFEGLYEISNLGRMRSLFYQGTQRKVPKVIVGGISAYGYRRAVLYLADQTRRSMTTHTMVADAFIGPRPACGGR